MKNNTNQTIKLLLRSAFVSSSLLFANAAFGAGNPTDTPGIPNLIYDPATGNMTVDTEGKAITSFQFENFNAGTFVAANYLSPADAPNNFFGFTFQQVTGNVIADSDALNAGFTGLHNFGNVLPAGLNQAQLQLYLETAFWGAFGAGSGEFDLVIAGATPFVLALDIAKNEGGPGFDLTWTNREFKTYDLESCTDLVSWDAFDPDGPGGPLDPLFDIPYSGSETNALTVNTPADAKRFFRVVENNELLFFENFDGAGFASGFPAGWVTEETATVDFTTFPFGPGDPNNLPEVETKWQVGTPSGAPSPGYTEYLLERDGPAGADSPTRCAGTNITNGYCGRAWVVTLTSPAIPVEGTAPLLLSFRQWISTRGGDNPDSASVAVLDALDGDSVVTELFNISDGGASPAWSANQLAIPLETVAGLTLDGSGQASIKLRFTFFSSSHNAMNPIDPVAGFREPVAGFYIDDLKVEFNAPE